MCLEVARRRNPISPEGDHGLYPTEERADRSSSKIRALVGSGSLESWIGPVSRRTAIERREARCYGDRMPLDPASGSRLLGTWSFSQAALQQAWPALAEGGGEASLLDALERACAHADLDPGVDSVGFGGLPDASGRISLDGAICLGPARFGGVCGLRRHLHPVAVARLVMERTEHRLLCGEDADDFADRHGLPPAELLADEAGKAWASWKRRADSGDAGPVDQSKDSALLGLRPIDPGPGGATSGRLFRPLSDDREGAAPFGHDTIGVLGRSADGVLGAACSTSGLPFKVPGRVGDSPIMGHGLFVEPGVGSATATGTGELISGICASMVAIEALRRGASPLEAIVEVMRRVEAVGDLRPHHQVALIVMGADGAVATGGFRPGFLSAVHDDEGSRILEPDLVHRPDDEALPESATDGFAKAVPPPTS